MVSMIRKYDNQNQPIVDAGSDTLDLTYFNLLHLKQGQEWQGQIEGFETVFVVLHGNCDIHVDGQPFDNVGSRADIWSGLADSVYAPRSAQVNVCATSATVEVAVAGGRCENTYTPFRITPDDVEMVDVGSAETHSRRRIYHILGQNGAGRVDRLLVSELHADPGCWSGYPPHKHDEERGEAETAHEEIYHYRFRPENGFGVQVNFQPDGESQVYMTRNGDTYLLDAGYHPTATSPGHEEYIFTILVGKERRSLIQHFAEEYQHLMEAIPGIQNMRDKFK